ncbi:hypothetical protein [Streptomyces sp. 184]|uniref:hypothetical protein n=1 Tax=Streptomyces sp. 184 TaxID=1827526 RepID=UPI0038924521
MTILYTTPDHRVWDLGRDYVDNLKTHWKWDGQPYDPAGGPEFTSPEHPLLHVPLIGLAAHCGLRSDPTDAIGHGALLLDAHDAADAGLSHPGGRRG